MATAAWDENGEETESGAETEATESEEGDGNGPDGRAVGPSGQPGSGGGPFDSGEGGPDREGDPFGDGCRSAATARSGTAEGTDNEGPFYPADPSTRSVPGGSWPLDGVIALRAVSDRTRRPAAVVTRPTAHVVVGDERGTAPDGDGDGRNVHRAAKHGIRRP